jgi:F-type H+-transporting ATPase subunit epsilon
VDVQLVSPEKILYEGEATMVILRTLEEGDVAFLDNHAPFIGALAEGEITVRSTEGDKTFAATGGFVEVSKNVVTIVSDAAESE